MAGASPNTLVLTCVTESVIDIVDSNNSIENISYVIPGNDDSSRAIRLYSRGMADAVLAGKNQAITELAKSVSEETTEE